MEIEATERSDCLKHKQQQRRRRGGDDDVRSARQDSAKISLCAYNFIAVGVNAYLFISATTAAATIVFSLGLDCTSLPIVLCDSNYFRQLQGQAV